jgi:hypothetical protein
VDAIISILELTMTTRRDLGISCLAAGATAYFATAVAGIAEGLADTSASKASVDLTTAMIAADRARLDALLSPDLSFGHSNGLVQSKDEFIKSVLTKEEVFKTIRSTDHTVQNIGGNAVIRQVFNSDLVYKGQELSVRLGELQVWQKQTGRWRMITRQAFKI